MGIFYRSSASRRSNRKRNSQKVFAWTLGIFVFLIFLSLGLKRYSNIFTHYVRQSSTLKFRTISRYSLVRSKFNCTLEEQGSRELKNCWAFLGTKAFFLENMIIIWGSLKEKNYQIFPVDYFRVLYSPPVLQTFFFFFQCCSKTCLEVMNQKVMGSWKQNGLESPSTNLFCA